MTDNEIMDSLYNDEASGFTTLIRTYADLVYKIVYEILSQSGSLLDIEDCVCDSFAAFYNNMDDVDLSRGSIKGYLGVIARRRAVNLRFTLNPDDDMIFHEYTVEEMSRILEGEEAREYMGLSDVIVRRCLKEITGEVPEEYEVKADEYYEAETQEDYETQTQEEAEDDIDEAPEEAIEETAKGPIVEIEETKATGFGRVLKTFVAMVSLVLVIVVAVIAYDRLSVPKYVPPTTQPTTQADSSNPLFSAITAGNEKLIEQLIANSLLISQDVLKFAVEYADKISYDSIRKIAEEVKNKYGSTGLDPILDGAIFGDFKSVEEKLRGKDESEMTPAEKLALFFITTFSGEVVQ